MKTARGRADARWLPSRHRFALSRLVAYLIFRATGPREKPGLVLAIDRDQSAAENYIVGAWLMAGLTCLFFGLMDRLMSRTAAIVAAPVAAMVYIQILPILTLLGGPRMRQRSNIDLVSFVMMFGAAVLAIYMAGMAGWVRYAAWGFLAVYGLNAAAWVAGLAMRSRFEEAEREAGVV